MTILGWGPSRGIIFLHERMGQVFDDAIDALSADSKLHSIWVPPCDICETDRDFILKVETPGVELDDVLLEIRGLVVTIAGDKKRTQSESDRRYHRVERNDGKFHRSFTLPHSVDAKKVSASLNDGVLTVTLPKKKTKKPSNIIKIEIK
jgi:HSP20 family protein